MFRQVVLPVMLVGILFYTFSAATTYYTQWLDVSHERALAESNASMNAAASIQEEVWHFHAEFVSQEGQRFPTPARMAIFDKVLREQIPILSANTATDEERQLVEEIRSLAKRYRAEVEVVLNPGLRQPGFVPAARQAELYSLAAEISDKADHIREVNGELQESAISRRTQIGKIVMWSRTTAMFLLPTIGIALGWWTANRLQRSVAQIQVTLHDPAHATPGNLGTVQVHGGNELLSIQKQVEIIVSRLRQTSEDLQAARHEVLRAERLAAIGGLAAGVAHELRNPLTSVKLLLQHASSRGEAVIGTPRIGLILDEIERMEATIQGLIDFSRPARPQRKRHDLRQTLERALNLVEGRAEKQGVATEWDLGAIPVVVDGDPQQLHQVFVNLLINGIEAMPEGGALSVCITSDPESPHRTVEIRDTGVGIPPELLPRLFEPFATAKERGTGLGLAVSRRIMQEHDGSIVVRARAPRGTVFEVTLPGIATPSPAVIGFM
jgi:two-component system sensor histidine kinase HydH